MEWDDYYERWNCEFADLEGRTLTSVERVGDDDNELVFTTDTGHVFRQYHQRACCEDVYIESIVGDLHDLVGSPIIIAEEVRDPGLAPIPKQQPEDWWDDDGDNPFNPIPESYSWTFYKLATIKGYVDIRWYGTSNGCYSERATLECLFNPEGTPDE